MRFHAEYQTSQMETGLFRQKYQDREKFMAFCRECPHYNELWSCPPLSFDADEFFAPYEWVNLLCVQIHLDEETIRTADTAEKIKAAGWEIASQEGNRRTDAGTGGEDARKRLPVLRRVRLLRTLYPTRGTALLQAEGNALFDGRFRL